MAKNLPAMQETRVQSLGWEIPLEKGMATTPVFLPGEFHGQRNSVLVGYSLCGCKESDMTDRLTHITGLFSRILFFFSFEIILLSFHFVYLSLSLCNEMKWLPPPVMGEVVSLCGSIPRQSLCAQWL